MTNEWIKTIWYTDMTESYSENEIMSFAARMDLEVIMLNEVSQTEKDKYHMILLICGI